MATGTVKWFDSKKGYGFITQENGGKDIFVHISAVESAGYRNLDEGQRLSYDVVTEKNNKESAANLKTIG